MYKEYVERKVQSLHNLLQSQNRKTLIVGISGGVDSSVVLGLLKQLQLSYAGLYTVIPVIAPISESKGTTEQLEASKLGREVCSSFNYIPKEVELSSVAREVAVTLDLQTPYLKQQIDYWLRPMTFYSEAMKYENSILISTTNKSEWELGWFSQYLDIFGIHPIIDLFKSDVYKLAKYLEVPSSITDTAPKGGLATGESDEQALGFTYHEFEMYFRYGVKTLNNSLIQKRIKESDFKRNRFNKEFINSCLV